MWNLCRCKGHLLPETSYYGTRRIYSHPQGCRGV
nr:MAG TPA: hypothetical protein [Caudoviricetes sp.]